MADEVDALMAIRGSLEATEGIDLIKEASELGDYYSQAETCAITRALLPSGSSMPAPPACLSAAQTVLATNTNTTCLI